MSGGHSESLPAVNIHEVQNSIVSAQERVGVPPKSAGHSDLNTPGSATQTRQEARSPETSGGVWRERRPRETPAGSATASS
jgi:hypothetical protein